MLGAMRIGSKGSAEKPRSDDKQTLDSTLKEFEGRREGRKEGRNNPQELAAIIRPAGKALPFCACAARR